MIRKACGHRCEHDGGVMRGVCVLCGGGGGVTLPVVQVWPTPATPTTHNHNLGHAPPCLDGHNQRHAHYSLFSPFKICFFINICNLRSK